MQWGVEVRQRGGMPIKGGLMIPRGIPGYPLGDWIEHIPELVSWRVRKLEVWTPELSFSVTEITSRGINFLILLACPHSGLAPSHGLVVSSGREVHVLQVRSLGFAGCCPLNCRWLLDLGPCEAWQHLLQGDNLEDFTAVALIDKQTCELTSNHSACPLMA